VVDACEKGIELSDLEKTGSVIAIIRSLAAQESRFIDW
jgi:hypothetical protein